MGKKIGSAGVYTDSEEGEIAPNEQAVGSVIASFRQVVKEGELRLHPIIARLVDQQILEKLGVANRVTDVQGQDNPD